MNSVNPATLRDVVIILLALLGGVCLIINTIRSGRRTPPVDSDLATLKTQVDSLKEATEKKQDSVVCDQLIKGISGEMGSLREMLCGSSKRHSDHERKMSTQVGDIHSRIDRIDIAVAANGATLETFMSEIRNWRNNHDAKANHS